MLNHRSWKNGKFERFQCVLKQKMALSLSSVVMLLQSYVMR